MSVTRYLALYRKHGTSLAQHASTTLHQIGKEWKDITSTKIGVSIVFQSLEKMRIPRKIALHMLDTLPDAAAQAMTSVTSSDSNRWIPSCG